MAFNQNNFIKFVGIIISLIFTNCSIQSQKNVPTQMQSEANQIISFIKDNPDLFESSNICPSKIVPKFQKEVKYLDEGCENNPKKCLEECKKEDGNACYALALFLQKQKGIEVEQSNPLFFRSCKFGIISGCTNLAAYKLDLESKDGKYSSCAADTFEKTCQKNDSWGCSMYGTVLASGFGREQNYDEALKYLKKACKIFGNEDEACQGAKNVEKEIVKALNEKKKK